VRVAAGVAGAAGLAAALLAGLVAAAERGRPPGGLAEADRELVASAVRFTREHPTYEAWMRGASAATNSEWLLAAALLVAAGLAVRRRFGPAAWLALVAGLGHLVNPAAKQAVRRERPELAEPVARFDGFSFPAGHATSSTMVAGAVLVLAWPVLSRKGRAAASVGAVALVALASWSRLSLGGHYLSDLAGGVGLGTAWVAGWYAALPVLRRRLPGAPGRARPPVTTP
jgi:membrane-associated phospholipid phosphatase